MSATVQSGLVHPDAIQLTLRVSVVDRSENCTLDQGASAPVPERSVGPLRSMRARLARLVSAVRSGNTVGQAPITGFPSNGVASTAPMLPNRGQEARRGLVS